MLGNLGDKLNGSDITVPFCEGELHGSSCALNKEDLALCYAWLDFFSVIFVGVAYVWLYYYIREETKVLDANTVVPSTFTIFIPWVPPDTT
jgi:hypothetical protein